ncbi:MAG: HD domain-containing protein [Desulfovibrio sp.]|uniref:HD domain-containing protein n=1 Tax=Desulfovibrio sp. TaxID=885 RepID=UPI0025C0137C|nr:HD domain-containing protein [Desulfovibrio sp.]MCI7568378.1 HD domain-containing protein [Desulfovibrio sp.]
MNAALPDIRPHEEWFRAYVAAERAGERENPAPLDLKDLHTAKVLAHARAIVAEEAFAPTEARAALLAALYHDVARFEQYRRFRTFRDAESCNHGQWGVRILKREKRLDTEAPAIRRLTLAAVGMHNRYALPAGLPDAFRLVTCVVRDADKLDILRVMDESLHHPDAATRTAVLSLPDTPGLFSPRVRDDALCNRVASYADLRSVNDFRVLLGTWFGDLHFAASRRRFLAEGHARHLVETLPEDDAYAAVRTHLLNRLDNSPC